MLYALPFIAVEQIAAFQLESGCPLIVWLLQNRIGIITLSTNQSPQMGISYP
jgi:hypothetical protein